MSSYELPQIARQRLVHFAVASTTLEQSAAFNANRMREIEHAMATGNARPELQAELAALKQQRETSAERKRTAIELVTNLNQWVRQYRVQGTRLLEELPPSTMRPKKGEPLPIAIQRIRIEIQDLKRDLYKVSIARPTNSDYANLARNYVKRLSEQVRPSVTIDKLDQFRVNFNVGEMGGFTAVHAFAMLAWFDPERAAQRLVDRIEIMPRQPGLPQLSAGEKRERMAELEAKIFELENAEETWIAMAEKLDMNVQRRPDANPMAVLGLRPATPKSAKKSNGHARQSEPRVRLHAKDPRAKPGHDAAKRKLVDQQLAIDDDAAVPVEMGRAR